MIDLSSWRIKKIFDAKLYEKLIKIFKKNIKNLNLDKFFIFIYVYMCYYCLYGICIRWTFRRNIFEIVQALNVYNESN